MGWSTNYSGPQMDATLEKGRDLKVVNNGWIKLGSSAENPTNLDNLKNPGNYLTFYWTNGPTLEDSSILPLNISIVSINGKIYQFSNVTGYTYSRSENNEKTGFTNWTIDQTSGIIKPGATAPNSPVDGKTLWLDTTNANAPILKLYTDGEWKEVIPAGIMQSSVYDSQGKRSDIFKYIEDSFIAATNNIASENIESHINNNDIHTTINEKNKWDSLPTSNNVDEKVDQIKLSLDSTIKNKITPNLSVFEELNQSINLTKATYDLHVGDTAVHPTEEKRTDWDNKAEGTHEHNLDEKVSVSPDHVTGIIPEEKLPYDVKEKVYNITSEDELSTKTKNPVHNGDVFYIESSNNIMWYFVIDDSYLGTNSALDNAFKKLDIKLNTAWSNVSNQPYTVEGYGISDAATKNDIDEIEIQVEEAASNIPDNIDSDITAIGNANVNYNKVNNELNQLKTTLNLLDTLTETYTAIYQ